MVDIQCLNIHIMGRLVHLYQRKQIIDDLVLPLDFLGHISHKFPVKLSRDFLLGQKRICQHLHGCQRRLQLMGHIRDKLLPCLIQYLESSDQLVKRLRKPNGLQKSIFMQLVSLRTLRHTFHGFRNPVQWPRNIKTYQNTGHNQHNKSCKNNNIHRLF